MGVESITTDSIQKWCNSYSVKNQFKNEKDYQEYIELNIKLFCKDVLDLGEYICHESSYYLKRQKFSGNKEQVDLYITGTLGSAIVELKHPKHTKAEIRSGISQLLHYGTLADRYGVKYDKLFLVSPAFDDDLFETIKKYKLPIHIVYLTKQHNAIIQIN